MKGVREGDGRQEAYTTATDVVLEGEHQSGRAVCVDACESLFSIAPVPGPLRGRATHAQNEAVKEFPSGLAHTPSIFVRKWNEEQVHRLAVMEPLLPFVDLAVPSCLDSLPGPRSPFL